MRSSAKFLVLLDDAARALLFDRDHRLLGEVIEDDGFIVDSLLRTADRCLPSECELLAVRPPPQLQQPMRCYALPDPTHLL